MEPPRTGWRTARGRPPLALQLKYLLTAFPASATNGGDQEQFAHAGLAAVMQALHANAIVTETEPVLSPLVKPLVEPLRIVMDTLDLEAISKLWTAASQPLRLSVGYDVSLVVIDTTARHTAGPPVKERRVVPAPTLGPRLGSVDPPRGSFGTAFTVEVAGLTAGTTFTLARETGDPAGPANGWPLTLVPNPPPGAVVLELPRADLAPGTRRIDAAAVEDGLLVGGDSIGVTVVPAITAPGGPIARNAVASLATAHAAADVEIFVGGTPLAPGRVTFVSPTQVDVNIPNTVAAGATDLALRANKVAGPPVGAVLT